MTKLLATCILGFVLAAATMFGGCSINPTTGQPQLSIGTSSPEAQIAAGARAETAASILGATLLKNKKISVPQAKGFNTILHASHTALADMNAVLLKCRADTGSTQKTTPDPCLFSVADVIGISTEAIAGVQRALSAKQ